VTPLEVQLCWSDEFLEGIGRSLAIERCLGPYSQPAVARGVVGIWVACLLNPLGFRQRADPHRFQHLHHLHGSAQRLPSRSIIASTVSSFDRPAQFAVSAALSTFRCGRCDQCARCRSMAAIRVRCGHTSGFLCCAYIAQYGATSPPAASKMRSPPGCAATKSVISKTPSP
jgi:hypothetical protein